MKWWDDCYRTRFQIIQQLDRVGFTCVEIRDYLNLNGIKPPRTHHYTTKLVWGTLKKLRERQQKLDSLDVEVSEVTVLIY